MKKNTYIASVITAMVILIAAPVQAHAKTMTIDPGDRIKSSYDSGYEEYCTLTGVVADAAGELYGVTAAHCIEEMEGEIPSEITMNNVQIANRASMEEAHTVIKHDRAGYGITDMALFRLNEGFGTTGVIGDTGIPVSGIGRVADLTPGQEICKYGAVTKKTCGKVTSVNEQRDDLYIDILAISGDSGSPFYTVTEDGSALIYAALSGGPDDYTNYADAVGNNFDQWGVTMGNDTVHPSPSNPPQWQSSRSSTSGKESMIFDEMSSQLGLSSMRDMQWNSLSSSR